VINIKDETKAEEIETSKLWLVLSRTHRALVGFIEGGIAAQGMNVSDFLVLEALFYHQPLGLEDIAQKTRLADPTVFGAVERLERFNLIGRTLCPQDFGESWTVTLTKHGFEVLSKVYAQHVKDTEIAMGGLTSEERVHLYRGLKKIGVDGGKLQIIRSNDKPGGLAPWQLRRATTYMAAHLDASVPLATIAAQIKLSESQLRRSFKVSTGITPRRWHLNLRIAKAQELLKESKVPMREIALETGFVALSHFCRTFRKVVGVPPSAWQRDHRP